jgi:hypothetical protein
MRREQEKGKVKNPTLSKTESMGHPRAFFGIKARPPASVAQDCQCPAPPRNQGRDGAGHLQRFRALKAFLFLISIFEFKRKAPPLAINKPKGVFRN